MAKQTNRPNTMTQERAACRYVQMRALELEVLRLNRHIADAKEALKELKQQRDGAIEALRAAARDESDLPLLRLAEELDAINEAIDEGAA